MSVTPNKGLRFPVITDDPDVPRDIHNLASDLDNVANFYSGTGAARVSFAASAKVGDVWWATDDTLLSAAGTPYVWQAGAWRLMVHPNDGSAATPSARTLGTGAAQAAAGNHRLDQHTAATATVNFGSQRAINVADPTSAQDAATRAFVDAINTALDARLDAIEAALETRQLRGPFSVNIPALAAGGGATVNGTGFNFAPGATDANTVILGATNSALGRPVLSSYDIVSTTAVDLVFFNPTGTASGILNFKFYAITG